MHLLLSRDFIYFAVVVRCHLYFDKKIIPRDLLINEKDRNYYYIIIHYRAKYNVAKGSVG